MNVIDTGLTKLAVAEYTILRYEAVAHIPKDVDASNYAPMLCAGSTVYNALRHSGLGPGDTVAIQGLGGVGHMAIPFAAKMGYRVVAISRGSDKEAAARKLGAHEYIDSNKGDPGAALKALGGAKVVLTTALAGDAIPPLIKGVKVLGKIAIISLPGDVTVNPLEMIAHGVSIQAWPVGSAEQSEKAIEFAQLHNLTCETETFPLSRAQDAYGTYFLDFCCQSLNLTSVVCRRYDERNGAIPCCDCYVRSVRERNGPGVVHPDVLYS